METLCYQQQIKSSKSVTINHKFLSFPTRTLQMASKEKLRSTIFFLFLFSIFRFVNAEDYTTNYIINGNFSSIPLNTPNNYYYYYYDGWNCEWLCQIKNCDLSVKYWLPSNLIDGDCKTQSIDLNSYTTNEVVYQDVNLKVGKYRLHFNYYYPVMNANLKMLQVKFNDDVIFYHHPQLVADSRTFQFDDIIFSKEGINRLIFKELGYVNDSVGFNINNVSLYRINDQALEAFVEGAVDNGNALNSLPGGRVLFRGALSFLMNFDRLQLYIYHGRTYSQNAQTFLVAVNDFLNAKSTLTIDMLDNINRDILQAQGHFTESASFKSQYIKYPSFNEDYQSVGYYQNLNQQFTLLCPLILIFLILFNLLFMLFFTHPLSLLFRKFSLWAIIFILLFDGGIENLTFFTFAEFKAFFAFCPYHKVLNCIVLSLFFAILFTIFALLLWGWYHYESKVKYLIDESVSKQSVLWGIMIDRGIICLLFGVIHQMLIKQANLQLFALLVLQVLWMIKKAVWVVKGLNEQRAAILISIINGGFRVFFQITCYLFQNDANMRLQINEQLHKYLIYGVIGTAVLEMLIGIVSSLMGLYKISIKGCSNKVVDQCADKLTKHVFNKILQKRQKNRNFKTKTQSPAPSPNSEVNLTKRSFDGRNQIKNFNKQQILHRSEKKESKKVNFQQLDL